MKITVKQELPLISASIKGDYDGDPAVRGNSDREYDVRGNSDGDSVVRWTLMGILN